MKNGLEINDYYDILLEISNPVYDIDYLPYTTTMESSVYTKDDVREKEIWVCDFPFISLDKKFKPRPALIIKDNDELKALVISSYEGKEEKVGRNKNTNIIIKNWKSMGLKKPSFAACNLVIPLNYISRFKFKIGIADDKFYSEIMKSYKNINFKYRKNIFALMDHLVNIGVYESIPVSGKNNNYNKMQTLSDIESSKQANCVDIASIAHVCCKVSNTKHWIIQTMFYNEDGSKSSGHVYVIFKTGNTLRSFNYFPNIKPGEPPVLAKIIDHKTNDISIAIKDIENMIRPHHEERLGFNAKVKSIILDDIDIRLWEKCLADRTSQKFLLEILYSKYSSNVNESLFIRNAFSTAIEKIIDS